MIYRDGFSGVVEMLTSILLVLVLGACPHHRVTPPSTTIVVNEDTSGLTTMWRMVVLDFAAGQGCWSLPRGENEPAQISFWVDPSGTPDPGVITTLRARYPEPGTRTSCLIDVLSIEGPESEAGLAVTIPLPH
jgi:hypothetical protein